jgi:hypothetical protein
VQPEDFFGYVTVPTSVWAAQLAPVARKHNMYIAAGMHAVPADYAESPWYSLDPEGKVGFNTILLVGRDGSVVGAYAPISPPHRPCDALRRPCGA